MKVQFLVTAHRDPALVWRLSERLLAVPDSRVLIQWDRARPVPVVPRALDVDFRVTQRASGWATGAQLAAELDSMSSLAGETFDWLVMLSGQCAPIRPLAELRHDLEQTPHAMFFESPQLVPVPSDAELADLQERYFFRYHWVPDRSWARLPGPAQSALAEAMRRVVDVAVPRRRALVRKRARPLSPGLALRVAHHPFTEDRPCRKGPDWFALSRPVFDDLVDAVARDEPLVRYFEGTYCPTESLFQTVLWPRWGDRNAGHNLHYRRFVAGRASPEVLDASDWDGMVASRRFFARKFDASSLPLLERIDRELLDS